MEDNKLQERMKIFWDQMDERANDILNRINAPELKDRAIPYAPAESHEDEVLNSIVGGQQNTINKDPDKLLSRLEILRQINYEKEALSDEDAAGHIWWNKFEEMIKYL